MAEKYHLIDIWQIEGRLKRSAVDACLMIACIEDGAKHKELTTSTFYMDMKGAFNNGYLKCLLNTMIEQDLPLPLQKWVVSFLRNRTARLTFNGDTEEMSPVSTGIPQGSPMSPILFLLYLPPLYDKLEKKHPEAICASYIDDVSILVVAKSEEGNCKPLQKMAARAIAWGERNARMFDNPKSELMHFQQERTTDPNTTVKTPDGPIIKPESVLRWLGVWWTEK